MQRGLQGLGSQFYSAAERDECTAVRLLFLQLGYGLAPNAVTAVDDVGKPRLMYIKARWCSVQYECMTAYECRHEPERLEEMLEAVIMAEVRSTVDDVHSCPCTF